MKYFLILSVLFFLSCQKSSSGETADFSGEMTVVKDCTGTYLKFNNLDYHICNKSLLENFLDGDKVKASLKKQTECSENQDKVCYLYHENEGWVRIISLN